MKVERVTLDKLHMDPSNARAHPEHNMMAITASLEQFGQVEPLVVQKSTGKIIGGNGRYEAMRKHGWTECEVAYVDVDDTQAVALGIALNRTSELAVWDEKTLAALLDSVRNEVEPAAMGFTDEEINALIASVSVTEGQTDPDAVPEAQEDPVTQTGDLWLLGVHRLVCGDSTDPEVAERAMGGERYQLMVTDPPYGVSYASKNEFLNHYDKGNSVQAPIENDDRSPEEMSEFWRNAFSTARAFAEKGACYYVTGPQGGDLLLLLLLALKDSDFPLRHMLIWAKNNHVLGRSDYNYKHEPIVYGWVEGGHKFHGGHDVSLWEIDRPSSSKLHPTMKPVELYERAIKNSSAPGEVVFEPFAGSGTAIIACEAQGRECRAIELSRHYTDVCVRRWQEFAGKDATLEGTDKTFNQIAEERLSVASPNE